MPREEEARGEADVQERKDRNGEADVELVDKLLVSAEHVDDQHGAKRGREQDIEWDESEQGLYRLRVNRSWVNGKGEYMDLAGVGRCLAGFVARMDDSDPDRPCTPPVRREVHALDPCWADYGPKDKDGMQYESCQARVVSDDTVIGMDGRQYVVVSAPELGGVRLMAIDDLRFYDRTPNEQRGGQ